MQCFITPRIQLFSLLEGRVYLNILFSQLPKYPELLHRPYKLFHPLFFFYLILVQLKILTNHLIKRFWQLLVKPFAKIDNRLLLLLFTQLFPKCPYDFFCIFDSSAGTSSSICRINQLFQIHIYRFTLRILQLLFFFFLPRIFENVDYCLKKYQQNPRVESVLARTLYQVIEPVGHLDEHVFFW